MPIPHRLLLLGLPILVAAAPSDHAAYNTQTFGGSGGTAYSLRCPAGSVLTGVSASGGKWFDRVSGFCTQVRSDGTLGGSTTMSGSAGGAGGTTADEARCGAGAVVGSFRIYAGMYVHRVLLRCFPWKPATRTWDRFGAETGGWVNTLHGGTLGGADCSRAVQPAVGIRGRAGMYVDSFGLICDEP